MSGELEKRIEDYLLDICIDDMLGIPEGIHKIFEEMWSEFPKKEQYYTLLSQVPIGEPEYDQREIDKWFEKWSGKK